MELAEEEGAGEGQGAAGEAVIASCSSAEKAVRVWRRRRQGDLGGGSGGGGGDGAGGGAEVGTGGWTCVAEIKEVSHDERLTRGSVVAVAAARHGLGQRPFFPWILISR